MKNGFIYLLFFLLLIFSCQSVKDSKKEFENEVKMLDSEELYSPTENEKAAEFYNKGNDCVQNEEYSKAINLYLKALELDPVFTDAMDNLGVIYRIKGDYDLAEQWYLKSLKILSNNDVAIINLALVYRLKKDFKKAEYLYSKLIDIDKSNPEGFFGLGGLYFDQKDFNRAVEYYKKAVPLYLNKKSEYVFDAYHMIGLSYFQMHDWDNTVLYLEKVMQKYPDNHELKEYLDKAKKRIIKKK